MLIHPGYPEHVRAAGTLPALYIADHVAALNDRVENALNETRMLILGAQVLFGFEYQAVFQPAFERLPWPSHIVKLVGLTLMSAAVGLLIAPSAFHQIVERGNDTRRVLDFTGRIATVALLPFAIGMGLDFYLAGQVVLGPSAALTVGVAISGFALALWYGLEWLLRLIRRAREKRKMDDSTERTPLETKIKLVLTEARVVLPGAQALLGFQFAAMLTDQFEKLPRSSQYVHLASLGLIAATVVFLMAPAAYHRIVERGEDTERVHRFASAMVLTAMVPLALGMSGDFYVVVARVLESTTVAVASASACLVFFFGLWFGLTLIVRASR
jgi:hypothetical protein